MTLALTDARRDERIAFKVGSGAAFRVSLDLGGLDIRPFDRLRLMLVADVLCRAIENLHGGQALLHVMSEGNGLWSGTLSRDDFSIRPPMVSADIARDATLLGGYVEIAVASGVAHPDDRSFDASVPHCTLRVGPVVARDLGADIPRIVERWEPLAVRLVLLRSAYTPPAFLTAARLRRAQATLERWRFKVAGWADVASTPMPSKVVDELRTAIDDDLDTAEVLRSLHRLEIDSATASGVKFETFAFIDRVLGLDLCQLVGKLRG